MSRLSPSPPRVFWVTLFAALLPMPTIPFARREDLLGWIALLTIYASAAILWSCILWMLATRFIERRRAG